MSAERGAVPSDAVVLPDAATSGAPGLASGNAPSSCTSTQDCTAGSCTSVRCEDRRCVSKPIDDGQPLPAAEQNDGDCQLLVCDGRGGRRALPDDGDPPEPSPNPCRRAACRAGDVVITATAPLEPCSTGTPCSVGQWSCPADGASQPVCVAKPAADGTSCAADSVCRAGECRRSALSNGSFADGLRGWTATGAASEFVVIPFDQLPGENRLSTLGRAGEATIGNLSQSFEVPSDAMALHFHVAAGAAHVRLRATSGTILEDVIGSDGGVVPVSWKLNVRRGQRLTLEIDDELGDGHVDLIGFDLVRDVSVGLRNPSFEQGFEGWEVSGDASSFQIFADPNHATASDQIADGIPAYGDRQSVSSYVLVADAPRMGDAAVGSLEQNFLVPVDARWLRFQVHGGMPGHVRLYEGSQLLYSVSPLNANFPKVSASWDLAPHRGKTLRLVFVDEANSAWGYIGCSGFDLITSYNGP